MTHTPDARPTWRFSALWRRWLFLLLIVVPSVLAASYMSALLPYGGGTLVELILCVLFGVLFAWISTGFWTALFGFFVLLFRYSGYRIIDPGSPLPDLPQEVRTTVLIPVYNEDPRSVGAGIAAMWRSLSATGLEGRFDLFILSDTTDPDIWVREEAMWNELRSRPGMEGHLFYRRRPSNPKRKSGNIANFCRRWGRNYRYMIVLDADSVMAGETWVRMVDAMERNPRIGILQTPPKGVNRETLIARVQQFANSLYGPLFAAGQNFWQLGDAQYWGHNAIIRVEPFMRWCELPRLPGRGPLSGDILSHDFVESALIRRAGYEVWLAYGVGGSYEETPPTLIDELKRDRRWCQGNLQHLRLIFTYGFFPTHRALFLNGILSYGSALLWLIFLAASSVQALMDVLVEPVYFPQHNMLFPKWHVWYPEWALSLLSCTALLLFLPKILCLLHTLLTARNARSYGGAGRVLLGVAGETVLSMLLAPVRMICHSRFVLMTLLGWGTGWGGQSRDDRGTSWGEAARAHWWATAIGLLWGWLLYRATPSFFLWLLPVILPLILSVPLSVFTSRASLGRAAGRAGLFAIPEELCVPPELADKAEELKGHRRYDPLNVSEEEGFRRAVLDPRLNALHRAMNRRLRARLDPDLVERALSGVPLSKGEKMALLSSPDSMRELHRRVWLLPEAEGEEWGI
ncbi:glucans biosynthesis glucosyltransferase MdoH [uncultured Fretibacterium sp.]|uniref:glucans biosynthesis glucosyltransferase MdoH n=1 Tax=uncultured Fretibacterium sp. TaxID=1678694 RepID=UPI0026236EEE|nr:glucans biosynthesis glucosyltransferase MdoH [uncultured Fretibacterium sp.]